MAVTAVTQQADLGDVIVYSGGASEDDNEVLLTLDARGAREITFGSTAGAIDVLASLDGTNFLTTPLAFEDLGDTTGGLADYVIVTAANRVYRIRGTYRALRFLQNGATGVANFSVNVRR